MITLKGQKRAKREMVGWGGLRLGKEYLGMGYSGGDTLEMGYLGMGKCMYLEWGLNEWGL